MVIAIAIAIAILIAVSWQSYRNMSALADADHRQMHTVDVIQTLERLQSDVLAAETEQSNFIITGRDGSRASYTHAREAVTQRLAALDRLTADNPARQRRLADITQLTQMKLAELDEAVMARSSQGFEATQSMVASHLETPLMEQIHKTIATAQTDEERRLTDRAAQKESKNTRIFWTLSVGALVVVSLILVVIAILWWEILRRLQVEEAIRIQDDNLDDLVKVRTLALEIANEAKSRFLAAVSHDLRQPFQAMRLFHSVLQASATDTRQIDVLAKFDRAMAAGEALLTSLLDLAKLDAGQETILNEPVSLSEVFGAIVSDYAPLAAEKGLQLRMHCPEITVMADRMALLRIIANLTTNALRYTERGGVLLACRRHHGLPFIEVWDTGIGIAPDQLEVIFEEFYQVGNEERDRRHGLGLGLSIVQRLCGLMNCQLSVRSRLGKGTVFSVGLPPSIDSVERSQK
ncbi:MAG TPA: CHASE3 domain-containing protein [Telmatospirillum sp.]|nr:CHASE3 domain-containing protein [Telmatospirillum sp.]